MKKFNLIVVFVFFIMFMPIAVFSHEKEKTNKNDHSPVVCPQDVKKCSDGTFVSRKGDDCEFAECFENESKEKGDIENEEDQDDRYEEKLGENNKKEDENHESDCKDEGDESSDCKGDDTEDDDSDFSKKMEERKKRVESAVEKIVSLSEKTGAMGVQIRKIAQEQKENYEKTEEQMKEISKRGGFMRFFVGPDYSKIKEVEKYTEKYNEKIQEMEQVAEQVTAQDVIDSIDLQIKEMQQIKLDLENDVKAQKEKFSLFGWLNRLLNK